jgi:RNA polymerase primary sigma factor
VAERQRRLHRAARRPELELGREARHEELISETGIAPGHALEALEAVAVSVSLNQRISEGDTELGELMPDDGAPDAVAAAEQWLTREHVRRALEELPDRARRILELRFGFEGEPMTLESIGRELGLARERVRQLESQALEKLATGPLAHLDPALAKAS